jgi:thiol-disulfide isomerase/thioredoxin
VRRAGLPHNETANGNGMKKLLIFVVAALASLSVLLTALSAERSGHLFAMNRILPAHSASHAAAAKQDDSKDASDDSMVIRFARNPTPMPPFLVNDIDGNIVSTASWRGKVVLLNFWATWCPPCRDEIPEMVELQSRYKDRLQVVGVSMDDSPPEEVREFARQIGITYPVVMGSRAIEAEYGGVPALPTSFVIGPDGGVVQKHVGLYPIDVYETEVRYLLNLPINAKVETFDDTGQIFLKNASHATELPGVDFKGLTQEQKRVALKRMNSENCTCGCKLTIAQCRINDSTCRTSQALAAKIVRDAGSTRAATSRSASPAN